MKTEFKENCYYKNGHGVVHRIVDIDSDAPEESHPITTHKYSRFQASGRSVAGHSSKDDLIPIKLDDCCVDRYLK